MTTHIKKILFILAAIFTQLSPTLNAGIDLSGYYENRFFLLNQYDIQWDNFKEKFKLSDYNRLRLRLKASPSDKVTFNASVDFFSFHGLMSSPLGTYEQSGDTIQINDEKNSVKIDLDRAFVDLYFKHFDLTIGKQRVAMGVSYIWAPLDVFNRVNILEPKEEKPGVNAVKIYVPLGAASGLTGVFSPEDDFSSSKSGIRVHTQILNIDAALTLIHWGLTDTTIYGIDLRGENFIGWWVEAGYFVSSTRKDEKIAVGFDYTFPIKRGLYWRSEYFYDASGEKDPGSYDYQQVLTGQRFTLGRQYLFSMLQFAFSDFFNASFSYVGNLDDGSCMLSPTIQYEISQNVSITSGFYFLTGKKNGEFNQNRQHVFFTWLKVTF